MSQTCGFFCVYGNTLAPVPCWNKYSFPTNSGIPFPSWFIGLPLISTFDIGDLVVKRNVAELGIPHHPLPLYMRIFYLTLNTLMKKVTSEWKIFYRRLCPPKNDIANPPPFEKSRPHKTWRLHNSISTCIRVTFLFPINTYAKNRLFVIGIYVYCTFKVLKIKFCLVIKIWLNKHCK